jgi:uncharacterized protein with GYD domain
MAVYMIQAAYTSGAWGKLVQLGGQLLAWYYSFGEFDVMLLLEVPSEINAAAASMAVAAGGAVRAIKTTPLMSPEDGFDALLLAQGAGYRPPGS